MVDYKCPNCGGVVEKSWKLCPFCEEKIQDIGFEEEKTKIYSDKVCNKCGTRLEEDWIRCPNCLENLNDLENTGNKITGNLIKSEIPQRNKIIAGLFILIFLSVGAYYLLVPRYQFEEYNKILDAVNYELDQRDNLIDSYNNELDTWNEKYDKIDLDSIDPKVHENNAKLIREYNTKMIFLQSNLTQANNYCNNAIKLWQGAKKLKLPNGYYEYIDLKISALEKEREARSKSIQAENERRKIREFDAAYGDIQSVALKILTSGYSFTNNLEQMMNYLDNSFYFDLYYTSFKKDLNEIINNYGSLITKQEDAYNSIPLTRLKSNIDKTKCSLSAFTQIRDSFTAIEKGYGNSSSLTNALNKLDSCGNIYNYESIMEDKTNWKKQNVDPLQKESDRLFQESKELDQKANLLWGSIKT